MPWQGLTKRGSDSRCRGARRRAGGTFLRDGMRAGMSWGTPGLKLKGRFLARLEGGRRVLRIRIGFERRDQLMQTSPGALYITDHYAGYPAVLVRLPAVRKSVVEALLREAWCEVAPESLLAAQRPQRTRSARRKKAR